MSSRGQFKQEVRAGPRAVAQVEEDMKRGSYAVAIRGLLAAALAFGASAVCAQTPEPYPHKVVNILVGVEAGGTADTVVRKFALHLRKHLPGAPNIIVQNMTGAGSNLVFNYYAE